LKKVGVWVEVTTLIVPGLNDEEQELRDIADLSEALDRKCHGTSRSFI
jgi:pyruvate formate lyase activating enzyme